MNFNVLNQTILPAPTEGIPGMDYALRLVVSAVNDSCVEIPIVLSSGAVVIKGKLISMGAYYDKLAISLANALNVAGGLSQALQELKGSASNLPFYIHLNDAEIIGAHPQAIISCEGLWRGATSKVDWYSLG